MADKSKFGEIKMKRLNTSKLSGKGWRMSRKGKIVRKLIMLILRTIGINMKVIERSYF